MIIIIMIIIIIGIVIIIITRIIITHIGMFVSPDLLWKYWIELVVM